MEQLLDPIFLSHRVDVGDLVVRQGGEVQVDLNTKFLIIIFFPKKIDNE